MRLSNVFIVLTFLLLAVPARAIDLSGEWRFALDARDQGMRGSSGEWTLPDKIRLPGVVTAQGFGEVPSFTTAWTGDGWRYPGLFKEWQADDNFKFPFFLQPPRHFVGPAWYQREIEIPTDWRGSNTLLYLERVHWHSTVWVDGAERGKGDSLGTPHEIDLGTLTPGKHVLTLRIDNRLGEVNVGPLSHSVTDHTQGNWNGVVGKIELRRQAAAHIDNLQVFALADGTVRLVVAGTAGADSHAATVRAELGLPNEPGAAVVVQSAVLPRQSDGTFEVEMNAKLMGPPKTWSEFQPNLYQAEVSLATGAGNTVDKKRVTFGIREPGSKDGRITLNGRKIFLRGTLECCIFPLTGYPPTDVESWRRIVRICKAHGLNHIRFHSWCPPEAAFAAADELGFYYQVEVSSWANQGAEIGSGRPLDAWIEAETARMLAAYGNHPSFLLLAYGNEPAGAKHPKWLQDWVARRKLDDPRRLHTTGSGWPIMPGSDYHSSPDPRLQAWGQGMKSIINGEAPRTDFDWRGFVQAHADAPVISHEIGQWCVYPNFGEIGKYTGYFKARNFEIFQETARRAGLLDQSKDFLKASGRLQVLAYKHDIEAALRTPGFGGFQLLDLHDFPGQGTALVGVLDAFWDEKGYVSPEQYRRFCGPIVPLARLKKMVFTTAESLDAELELAQFGPQDLPMVSPTWKLTTTDGTTVADGTMPARDLPAGELHQLGAIRVPLGKVQAPAKLTLTVGADGQDFSNSWEVFVYPAVGVAVNVPGVSVTRDLAAAQGSLARGEKVLWLPRAADVRNDAVRPLIAGFSPIFWNTAWTQWQPPHTLGILCDPKHPALAGFPTDFHSNWQWWEIQQDAQPFILTELRGIKPIVQVIDDWVTNRKLGYVFEARVGPGSLVACSADLETNLLGRPAVRQLRASLLQYMAGESFAPKVTLTSAELGQLVK
jgi:hypothetical protein